MLPCDSAGQEADTLPYGLDFQALAFSAFQNPFTLVAIRFFHCERVTSSTMALRATWPAKAKLLIFACLNSAAYFFVRCAIWRILSFEKGKDSRRKALAFFVFDTPDTWLRELVKPHQSRPLFAGEVLTPWLTYMDAVSPRTGTAQLLQFGFYFHPLRLRIHQGPFALLPRL